MVKKERETVDIEIVCRDEEKKTLMKSLIDDTFQILFVFAFLAPKNEANAHLKCCTMMDNKMTRPFFLSVIRSLEVWFLRRTTPKVPRLQQTSGGIVN